jgi:hypothetical protein
MPEVPIGVAVATTWRSVPPSLPLLKRTPLLASVVVASCHAGDPNRHREASSCIPLRWIEVVTASKVSFRLARSLVAAAHCYKRVRRLLR